MKKLWVCLFIILIFVFPFNAFATTILFNENFESYDVGSSIAGQGGWTGGTIYVGEGGVLGTKFANGRDAGNSGQQIISNSSFSLNSFSKYELSFDAYTSSDQLSHNSILGLFDSDSNFYVRWENEGVDPMNWGFQTPGDRYEIYGSYDTIASLSIILDPINLVTYGVAEINGQIYETNHRSITLNQLVSIDSIRMYQDFRSTSVYFGTDMDNITLTETPVPEPTTMLLLGTGLIGFAGARRRRRK